MFKEAFLEILTENRKLLRDIFEEIIEDFSLRKAIEQRRQINSYPKKKFMSRWKNNLEASIIRNFFKGFKKDKWPGITS